MDPHGPRSYRLLAEIALSALAADPDPAAKAVHTGRAWGGFLIEQPAPAVPLNEDGAVDRLVDLLHDLGFAPGQQSSPEGTQIGLHNCPFLELVESQTQQVICPLHLGLMQGAMAALGSRTTIDRLEPFAEPGLCLAHVTPGDAP
jgi:predicted ArsR family transcriptional regulator